jgi:glycosyltransferase involved in cell wall biosynthesis
VALTGTEGMMVGNVQVEAAKRIYDLCVCICTFKRPELLRRLLDSLSNQSTAGLFTYSITVADNDAMQSARKVVDAFSSQSPLAVTYCVESQQNIALARNKALEHADGDFVVFVDDDEFADENWLLNLLNTCLAYEADGVLGPVKSRFDLEPPQWVRKGGFFDRPTYATGSKMRWPETRTGNVLFRKKILNGFESPFRAEFDTAGEDMDFFRRMMEKGHTFVWCNEAVVYELVPPSRCTRSFLLKRALLRGSNFPKHPQHRIRNIAKSLVAVPSYTLALPVLSIFGEHVFVTYLSKLLDHASRLLAFVGFTLAKERET